MCLRSRAVGSATLAVERSFYATNVRSLFGPGQLLESLTPVAESKSGRQSAIPEFCGVDSSLYCMSKIRVE